MWRIDCAAATEPWPRIKATGCGPNVAASARPSADDDEMPPPVVYALPTYVTPPAWRWTGPYVGVNGGFGSSSR